MKALLRAVSGLIIWAVAFATLYGLEGLACADGRPHFLAFGRWLLILPWGVSLILLGWMTWHFLHHRQAGPFLDRLAIGSAAAGFLATLYTGAPVLAASMCIV